MVSTPLIQPITTIEDAVLDFTDKAPPIMLNCLTRAEEEGTENSRWQDLMDRAHARTKIYHRSEHDFDDDAEAYELQEDDVLWEIGCKVSFTNI